MGHIFVSQRFVLFLWLLSFILTHYFSLVSLILFLFFNHWWIWETMVCLFFLKKDCFTLTSLTYFFYFWSWMTTIDSGIKGSNRRNERSYIAKICWPKIYLWKEKLIPSYGHMEVGDIKIHFKKGQPERQQRSSHHSNKYRNSKNQQHEGWTLSAAAHRTQGHPWIQVLFSK